MGVAGHGGAGLRSTVAVWTGTVAAVVALSAVLALAGLQAAPLFAALAVGLVVALGVPGQDVGGRRLVGGSPPIALWRRSVL